MKNFSVIIVNYKTPELTLRCIESIFSTVSGSDFEVIVVDNCSLDNSEKLILTKFPEVIWINNSVNEGFGRANNIGINKSRGKYILLLNSDMVVLPDSIHACIEMADNDPTIGMVGCTLLNEDGSVQGSSFSIASFNQILCNNLLYDKIFHPKPPKKEALMGSFLLIPRKVFDKSGLFDPDFFMYCEELDLASRVLRAGYTIQLNTKVSAIHKHGGSSGNKLWVDTQKMLSNSLLFLKVRGWGGYIFYHLLTVFNFYVNFFSMWFVGKQYIRGYWYELRCYYRNFFHYFAIPLQYKTSMGTGKRLLKRNR